MYAMAAEPAWLAICLIVGLAGWWIIKKIPKKEVVLFEGILEEVECEDFVGDDPEIIYKFGNYFSYPLRSDCRLMAVATGCKVRLLAENRSGDYIPKSGDCVRVTARYNIIGEMIICKFENIEELRGKFSPAEEDIF